MVTKQDCLTGRYFRYLQGTYSRSKELKQVRASGKCQTWKTRPDDFKLPVKYGLYESLYITPENAAMFITEDEYQSRKEQAQAVGQVLKNPRLKLSGKMKVIPFNSDEQLQQAAELLRRASFDLGPNLGGNSPTDLLLDNMNISLERARDILKALGIDYKMNHARKNPMSQSEMLAHSAADFDRGVETVTGLSLGRKNPSVARDSTDASVRSPTSTRTATRAHTQGNITVTGGAGHGATNVTLYKKNPTKLKPLGTNQTELETDNGTTIFFSYQTPVAMHIPGMGYYITEKKWSNTTTRHIHKWLRTHGAHQWGTFPQEEFEKSVQSGQISTAFTRSFKKNSGTIRTSGKYKPRNRAHFDTEGKHAGNFLHVQQQRGAMWFTLAVSKNTDKGRKIARLWAERFHRKHPGTTLRLFV